MSKIRKKQKYPALDPKKNLKIRQELIDYDYIDKLSPEEKEWLNKFTEEYISASFKKDKAGRHSKGNLHKANLRKDCFSRNNKRNNDVLGLAKINNLVKPDEIKTIDNQNKQSKDEIEDRLISLIEDEIL